MIHSSVIYLFFVKICVLFTSILSCFHNKIGGYFTGSHLEFDILIIPGCCKKMVYRYVVVAKMKRTFFAYRDFKPGAFTLEV
jgi:hypothetical protein